VIRGSDGEVIAFKKSLDEEGLFLSLRNAAEGDEQLVEK